MPANRPEQPLKTQQLRKRYRQLRRKQLAGILLLFGLGLAVLVAIGVGIFFLRSCSKLSDGGVRARIEAERGAGSLPEVALEREFEPAPWLLAVGDSALFCATDAEGRKLGGDANYPVTELAAYSLADGTELWRTPTMSEYMGLATAEQALVLYSHSAGPPPQLVMRGLDQANGHEIWNQTINNAQSPSFAVSNKVFIVAYWLSDSFRLVGYNAASGIKAWGYKLKLADELAGFDLSVGTPQLLLAASPKLLCYALGSSIGFIDSGTGKVVRRQRLPAPIGQLVFDWENKSCLLASEADKDGVCTLYRMPISAGEPVALHRFIPAQGVPQLAHYGGSALVAYNGTEAGQQDAGCHVVCFERGAKTALSHTTLPEGVPVAAAAFPGGADGALVAVSYQVDEEKRPQGKGFLLRVSATTGVAEESGRLARPVAGLLPFKRDLVLLGAGGELRTCVASADRQLRLAALDMEHCDWAFSPTQAKLLVSCYPAAHAAGEPGGKLKAIVLK